MARPKSATLASTFLQRVFRLEISVDDVMLVDVSNTFQNLMDTIASTSFTVVLSSHNLFKELLARKKFKHEVVKTFFRNTLMKVMMFQKSVYSDLTL